MKKRFGLLICGLLLAASLLFMACPLDPEEPEAPAYLVKTETYLRPASGDPSLNPDVGIIKPTPESGPSGTEVTVAITSGDGYYLDEVFQDEVSKGATNPLKVTLLDKDVTIKAYFRELSQDSYKVTLEQPAGGTISFKIDDETKEHGPAGGTVTLSNTPSDGYTFKNYTVDGTVISGNTFTLTKNVTVSGVFEKVADEDEDKNENDGDNTNTNENNNNGNKIDELLAEGKDALKSGNFSSAITAYETAYSRDSNNAEALVYSAIGKLASVAWSSQVGNFFKNRLGLKSYPNTLDALIDPEDWFEKHPDKNNPGYELLQPPLNVPEWIKTKEPYTDSLVTIGGKPAVSNATWSIVLIANLIDKNTTGLNVALDDVIAAIFSNPAYTEAVNRTAKLKGKEPVKVDAGIINSFGLSQFFGTDDVYIGWAELELLLSALKLVKATLLYVDSYNWDYDIGFVKNLPWDESVLDKIDDIANNRNKVLPLRTGIMTARGGNYLTQSRTAFAEALTSIIGVYDYYTGTGSKLPTGYKDELNKFKWAKDAAGKLKNAITNGTTFYVKDSIPNGDTYDNTAADSLFSINFGTFFTSGQLALEKLIETEGADNTKSPVFYSLTRKPDGTLGTLTKITKKEDVEDCISDGNDIAFKFKIDPIGQIIGTDFTNDLLEGLGFVEFSGSDPVIAFDPKSAAIAWAAYHWDNESKELIEEIFAGDE